MLDWIGGGGGGEQGTQSSYNSHKTCTRRAHSVQGKWHQAKCLWLADSAFKSRAQHTAAKAGKRAADLAGNSHTAQVGITVLPLLLPFCHYIHSLYACMCGIERGRKRKGERETGWLRQTETEYETSRQWDTLFPMSSDNIIPQHKVETLNFVGTFAFWQPLASWPIGKQALFGPSKRRLTPLIEITATYTGQCQCLVPISGPYESTWFFLLPVLPPELGATFPCLSSSYIFKCASICM